jgi:DNA-binding CsgD family transcriptional regulator
MPEFQQGGSTEAQRRLWADLEIARRIEQVGYDLHHPICKMLADRLREIGVGTLVNLNKKDELFSKCAALSIRGLPPRPSTWQANAHQVIVDAVHLAVPLFVVKSMPKWNARSSIETYFVNYCLFEFKKIYLAFCKTAIEIPSSDTIIDFCSLLSAHDDPARQALNRQTLREITKLIDSRELADIIIMSASGESQKTIAKELEISETTVSRRLSSFREKLETNGWPTVGGR